MIALTLHGGTLSEARSALAEISGPAGAARGFDPEQDLVELRLDTFAPFEPAELHALLAESPLRILVTCRPLAQGGAYEGSEEERVALLQSCLHAGALVDLELDASGDATLRSLHDFEPKSRSEDELRELLASFPPGGTRKLALAVDDARDAVRLLRVALPTESSSQPTIPIAMGFPGVATRAFGPAGGAPWTYAPWHEPNAPGQRSLEDLIQLGLRRRPQRWFGVIGRPISHSRSPFLMSAVCARLGLDVGYTWLETSDPLGLLDEAELDPRWGGFSVTLPHKTTLLARSNPAPDAVSAGALNTLVRVGHEWHGYNTDALATLRLMNETPGTCRGTEIAVLGNGGAARAVASALRDVGGRVSLYTRSEERGRELAGEFNLRWGGFLDDLPRADESGPTLIVNATSVGMAPESEQSPVAPEVFGPERIAYDLVYTPRETRFLRDAAARGARTVDGVAHFLAQAREQVALFWGRDLANTLPPLSDPWWLEAARL